MHLIRRAVQYGNTATYGSGGLRVRGRHVSSRVFDAVIVQCYGDCVPVYGVLV